MSIIQVILIGFFLLVLLGLCLIGIGNFIHYIGLRIAGLHIGCKEIKMTKGMAYTNLKTRDGKQIYVTCNRDLIDKWGRKVEIDNIEAIPMKEILVTPYKEEELVKEGDLR